MAMSVGLIVGAFLVIWYSVTLGAAFIQEGKVGWPHFGRKLRMFIFLCGMIFSGSVQQLLALPYSWVAGRKESREMAQNLMRSFFSWFAPRMWGKIQMEGVDKLPKGNEGCIYLANHQSSVDFAMVFLMPNKPHTIGVAKSSMFLLPGFGVMTWLAGAIFINRGKKGTMASILEQGKDRLAQGISIGIFPQGTREVTKANGRTKPFKIGAFVLATKTKAPIVPLTFIYPEKFMESGGNPDGKPIRVIVHDLIEPGDDPEALRKKVEDIVMKPAIEAAKGLESKKNK